MRSVGGFSLKTTESILPSLVVMYKLDKKFTAFATVKSFLRVV